jgi:hypothetical protein
MSGLDEKPKQRKESYDLRLFFGFHASMMALMVLRFTARVGIVFEMVVVGGLLVVGLVLSVRHRRKHGWHWPRVGWKDVLGALVCAGLGVYFLGAALPGTTVFNPNLFPWLSAGGGILLFGVLSALKVCQATSEEFFRHCGVHHHVDPAPSLVSAKLQLPAWKKIVTGAFSAYFLAVWIAGVGFFWKFNAAFASGSKQPTATQTEKLTNHGRAVYITSEQKRIVNLLERSMMFGIPSVFVIGALLHFVIGVKIFSGGKDRS